jgi:hypothetical protein
MGNTPQLDLFDRYNRDHQNNLNPSVLDVGGSGGVAGGSVVGLGGWVGVKMVVWILERTSFERRTLLKSAQEDEAGCEHPEQLIHPGMRGNVPQGATS